MATGLFLGRFQPFHFGHLAIIKKALMEVDKLIIVIGSSKKSHTPENPFTLEERKKMIKAGLEGLKNYEICAVEDIECDGRYVGFLSSKVPKYDVVYAGENKMTAEIFSKAGYKIIASERINNWIAAEIRNKIINEDERWKDLMPKKVAEILIDIKGVERIKSLAE